jgi:NitT/TauT family transport system substrate-binding protein
MTGPTGIGLVSLMDKSENGETAQKYDFSLYASAQEIIPLLVKGELDIAAIPANLAAIQFNKNDALVQAIAINNLGVLSILEKGNSITSVADLKGKVIYAPASGKGAVPEYALNYILTQNGLDPSKDVTVEWKTEVTEIIATLKKSDEGIALLPQPAATNALNNVEGLHEAININDAWNALGLDSKLVTGVIVVRTAFAQANPEAVVKFLEEYEQSTKFVNENLKDGAKLVAKYKIASEAIAIVSIPKCNITFIKGDAMKTVLSAYLKTLFDENPASIGGVLPADSFYYVEK